MDSIHTQVLDSGVHVLTFDRPGSSANIFDPATLEELNDKLDPIEQAASGTTGVVFISAKPSIFIAGADLHAIEAMSPGDLEKYLELGQRVLSRVAALRVPTVAAIHGACVGGGYELCLACQWRIATAGRATKIGLPETQLGILPAWGGCTRLPRLIGVPRALDIILGGKTLPAKPALKRGMIDEIAPRELLLPAALSWLRHPRPRRERSQLIDRVSAAIAIPIARRRIAKKTRGLYPAPPKALEVIARGTVSSIEESLHLEHTAVLELAATPECRNLIRVFQLQERSRKLRFPGVEKPAPISRVAVIGAGVMGAAIAQWLSSRGLRVLLRDIDPGRVAAGMARIADLYTTAVKRGVMDKKEARDAMDRISPTADNPPMHQMGLVIEAAVEKQLLKERIFRLLNDNAPNALLATNTSALSITTLAAAVIDPARVLGIHFFNPVHRMPLVEVITGEKTSPQSAAAALSLVQQIGKLPVLVRDSPGFLVNRILLPYLVEAGELFAHGALIESIDSAMLDFGMPMGPLRLIDEVGLDVAQDVATTLAAAFPGHLHVPAIISKMVAAGLLGRKSGRGFYIYEKEKQVPNPDVAKNRESEDAARLDRTTLQRRMVLLMVNEAARCMEENVVSEPEDVDFGMIMGAGFPPFRGGPLRYADSLGAAAITDALRTEAGLSGAHFTPCKLLREMSETKRRFHVSR